MVDVVKVKVVTGARKNEVKREGERLKVYVSAPPAEGKANKAVLELLAKHFGCKESKVKIIKGEKSKDKLIQMSPEKAI